ncbi:hypothetical protein R4I43_08060 [Saccharopolyspora sp. S2-29]|uniref:Uncharacterized protein n=1 Tax=Saccharopolyspora mangrovi TaxID=3082379 RepID=A0ABU6A720_9PSEU|nr:hypothetical protein [Saccharopolyspora sp. S2-29]MEB3367358.1 hypothetical protein [Saccharopolyspora sp. S2-29]
MVAVVIVFVGQDEEVRDEAGDLTVGVATDPGRVVPVSAAGVAHDDHRAVLVVGEPPDLVVAVFFEALQDAVDVVLVVAVREVPLVDESPGPAVDRVAEERVPVQCRGVLPLDDRHLPRGDRLVADRDLDHGHGLVPARLVRFAEAGLGEHHRVGAGRDFLHERPVLGRAEHERLARMDLAGGTSTARFPGAAGRWRLRRCAGCGVNRRRRSCRSRGRGSAWGLFRCGDGSTRGASRFRFGPHAR